MARLSCSIVRYPRICAVCSAWIFAAAVATLIAGLAASKKSEISPVSITAFVLVAILGVTAMMVGLMGLSYRSAARGARACLQDFEAGKFLVHWKLDTSDIHNDAEIQLRQRRKNAIIGCVATAAGGGGFAILMGAILWSVDSARLGLWVIVPGCIGFPLLGWLLYIACMARARARANAILRGDGQVYIGDRGIYASGDFLGWGAPGRKLISISRIDGDPPTLEFTVKWSLGTWAKVFSLLAVFAGQVMQTEVTEKRIVPVPAGRESEARAVVEYLSQNCASAA